MQKQSLAGRVIRLQADFYYVDTPQGVVTCHMRGRLKRGIGWTDIVAVGDNVNITLQSEGSGMIEDVIPRKNALVRLDPRPRGVYQQVLLANPDQVVLVFACAQPEPHLRMLDRFLVVCEKQGIPILIVANKTDLVGVDQARQMFAMYPPIGYPLLLASAKTGYGLAELEQTFRGRISALAGPSGAGKSSLLNAIHPLLDLKVGEISQFTQRGRHTTVVRQMYALEGGGYVADMPGLRSLALWDTQPEELDGYFPELRPLVSQCQFNNCAHQTEPGCAVRRAVEEGRVHPERYESYLRLRFGERGDWDE